MEESCLLADERAGKKTKNWGEVKSCKLENQERRDSGSEHHRQAGLLSATKKCLSVAARAAHSSFSHPHVPHCE